MKISTKETLPKYVQIEKLQMQHICKNHQAAAAKKTYYNHKCNFIAAEPDSFLIIDFLTSIFHVVPQMRGSGKECQAKCLNF